MERGPGGLVGCRATGRGRDPAVPLKMNQLNLHVEGVDGHTFTSQLHVPRNFTAADKEPKRSPLAGGTAGTMESGLVRAIAPIDRGKVRPEIHHVRHERLEWREPEPPATRTIR